MEKLKLYGAAALIVLIAMVGSFYAGRWQRENQGGKPLPPADNMISRETFTPPPAMKRVNKKEAQQAGLISEDTAKKPDTSLLTVHKVEDDSGTLYVGAELGADGDTHITQHRPAAEVMSRNAIGLTLEANPHGITKDAYYTRTFGRLWDFYVSGGPGLRIRERDEKEWFLRLNAEYRF